MDGTMTGVGEHDVDRALRWLARAGVPLPATRDACGPTALGLTALGLTARRLAARRRIRVRAIAVVAGAAVLMLGWNAYTIPARPPQARSPVDGNHLVLIGVYCLPALFYAWGMRAAAAADRRILRALPQGARRRAGTPLSLILGSVRIVVAGALLVLCGISSTAAWVTRPVPFAAAACLLVGLAVAFSWFGLHVARTRPAIAVDALTLTIDEHLRTQEASFAVVAPVGGLLGLTGIPAAPDQLRWVLVPLVCDAAAVVLLVIAAISPPRGRSLPG